jgi:DNA-binding XRE family transcriptional regulator
MGKRLRLIELRRAAGHTQESLAHALGHHRSTVERWENGRTTPQPWEQPELARELAISRGELVAALSERPPLAAAPAVPEPGDMLGQRDRHETLLPGDEGAAAHNLFGTLDHARLLVDHTLSTGSASVARLDVIEERVTTHVAMYIRTPPAAVLQGIARDLFEVQGLAAQRQPAAVQSRLSASMAVLALMTADALMKLGEISRARYWYGTARLAADDTDDLRLRASVRAQAAMLPYYYGQVEQAVDLARAAQELLPHKACDATALAAAAEARGLARLGDHGGAEQAMQRAEEHVAGLTNPTPDAAFRFNEKRLLLYLSGTLTYLGDTRRARDVQAEALTRYQANPEIVIDPALIRLDQAAGQALDGDATSASNLAIDTLQELPEHHRTQIVLTRARDVVAALPPRSHDAPAVGELRELVNARGTEHI